VTEREICDLRKTLPHSLGYVFFKCGWTQEIVELAAKQSGLDVRVDKVEKHRFEIEAHVQGDLGMFWEIARQMAYN
jgi:hypothetical protein